jgi:hypothetical protein
MRNDGEMNLILNPLPEKNWLMKKIKMQARATRSP